MFSRRGACLAGGGSFKKLTTPGACPPIGKLVLQTGRLFSRRGVCLADGGACLAGGGLWIKHGGRILTKMRSRLDKTWGHPNDPPPINHKRSPTISSKRSHKEGATARADGRSGHQEGEDPGGHKSPDPEPKRSTERCIDIYIYSYVCTHIYRGSGGEKESSREGVRHPAHRKER